VCCAVVCAVYCSVMVQRFVCWMHTTPTILVLVKMMATNITRQQVGARLMVPGRGKGEAGVGLFIRAVASMQHTVNPVAAVSLKLYHIRSVVSRHHSCRRIQCWATSAAAALRQTSRAGRAPFRAACMAPKGPRSSMVTRERVCVLVLLLLLLCWLIPVPAGHPCCGVC